MPFDIFRSSGSPLFPRATSTAAAIVSRRPTSSQQPGPLYTARDERDSMEGPAANRHHFIRFKRTSRESARLEYILKAGARARSDFCSVIGNVSDFMSRQADFMVHRETGKLPFVSAAYFFSYADKEIWDLMGNGQPYPFEEIKPPYAWSDLSEHVLVATAKKHEAEGLLPTSISTRGGQEPEYEYVVKLQAAQLAQTHSWIKRYIVSNIHDMSPDDAGLFLRDLVRYGITTTTTTTTSHTHSFRVPVQRLDILCAVGPHAVRCLCKAVVARLEASRASRGSGGAGLSPTDWVGTLQWIKASWLSREDGRWAYILSRAERVLTVQKAFLKHLAGKGERVTEQERESIGRLLQGLERGPGRNSPALAVLEPSRALWDPLGVTAIKMRFERCRGL